MSRIASKQIVTNQNYSLVLWPLSAVDNWLGFLSQSIFSQVISELVVVSMCRQQLGVATTHSGWSISSIRSKCVCLCDLNLEQYITLKVGYIPCIFIFLLRTSSHMVWRVHWPNILALETQESGIAELKVSCEEGKQVWGKRKCGWFSEQHLNDQCKRKPWISIVMLLGRFKLFLNTSPCPSLGIFFTKQICLPSFFFSSPFSQTEGMIPELKAGKAIFHKGWGGQILTSQHHDVKAVAERTYPPCWALPQAVPGLLSFISLWEISVKKKVCQGRPKRRRKKRHPALTFVAECHIKRIQEQDFKQQF